MQHRAYDGPPLTPFSALYSARSSPSQFQTPLPQYSPYNNRFPPGYTPFTSPSRHEAPLERNYQRVSRFFRPAAGQWPPSTAFLPAQQQPQYSWYIAEEPLPSPVRQAQITQTYLKGLSVCTALAAGVAFFYSYELNELAVLTVPQYTQGGTSHPPQTIRVRAYGDISALTGSLWADWSTSSFWSFFVGNGPIISGLICLICALAQSYGRLIRAELPIALQALMAGACDQKYRDEVFKRYGVFNIKLWFLAPFSIFTAFLGLLNLIIYFTTKSTMSSVATLGPETPVNLGLTTICSLVGSILILICAVVTAYEQRTKARLQDLVRQAQLETSLDVQHPPEYGAGDPDEYSVIEYDEKPRVDSRHATRAFSVEKQSRKVRKTEWDDLSESELELRPPLKRSPTKQRKNSFDDITSVSHSSSKRKITSWGAPLQSAF